MDRVYIHLTENHDGLHNARVSEMLRNRLRERLKTVGLSAAEASRRAGRSDSLIKNILNKRTQSPQTQSIVGLSEVLECDPDYLMGLQAMPRIDKSRELAKLPVVGLLEASVWRESALCAEPLKEIYVVQDPRFSHLERYVLEVAGDSFDKTAPPGSFAVCVNLEETGLALKDGWTVVVERTRGNATEMTLKRVRLTESAVELHPNSHNPAHAPIPLEGNSGGDSIHVTGLVLDILIQLPI